MIVQKEAEKQILGTELPDGGAEHRKTKASGTPFNSFDEFELLMTSLGYRHAEPADFQRLSN
jgi:hypothetical protein